MQLATHCTKLMYRMKIISSCIIYCLSAMRTFLPTFLLLAVLSMAALGDEDDQITIDDGEEEDEKERFKCVNCMNCKMFEISSHSIDCLEGENRCLVRP